MCHIIVRINGVRLNVIRILISKFDFFYWFNTFIFYQLELFTLGIAGEKPYKERQDAGLEFAKLSYILANQFPKEKFQNLKDVILGMFFFHLHLFIEILKKTNLR